MLLLETISGKGRGLQLLQNQREKGLTQTGVLRHRDMSYEETVEDRAAFYWFQEYERVVDFPNLSFSQSSSKAEYRHKVE